MLIKVNWGKIKPFEKKGFAIGAMVGLAVLGIIFMVICGVVNGVGLFQKLAITTLSTVSLGLMVHIESRMLQIYMLQGYFDILMAICCSKAKGYVCITVAAVFLIGLLIALAVEQHLFKDNTLYDCTEPDRKNIYAGKNVLMFAPHEDDEINIYGGIIEQYVKNGSTVRVVFSTNGDVYGLGKLRIREALEVAKSYGIPKENFIFLGYSDSMRGASGKHIYNCDANEEVASVKGYTEAYGIDTHNSYSNKKFTRQNVLDDFKDVINEYKPDVLYCCDYDSHPDHRAIGLFFEEALGEILKENPFYSPKVYKGFAYSLAWMGKLDYYTPNSRSTHQWIVDDLMVENNVYAWAERLRLPVAKESLSHIMQNASSYVAMMKYSSQTATDHANGILNNDKVFWERRTDSLLYNAKAMATSGDASHIAEFKLVDSVDINELELMPSCNAWVADNEDKTPSVMLKLDEKQSISTVYIYESPLKENHIVSATVKIGNYQFEIKNLHKGANKFSFNPVLADTIAIRVDEWTGDCSILKVEAFENPDQTDIQLVKLVNDQDDFCYDYMLDPSGTEDFTVYHYPVDTPADFDVSCTGGVEVKNNDGKLTITCPQGESGVVTIKSLENPAIYDEVKISNPTLKDRAKITKRQALEPRLWTLPMQYDYYIGAIRRLGVYR